MRIQAVIEQRLDEAISRLGNWAWRIDGAMLRIAPGLGTKDQIVEHLPDIAEICWALTSLTHVFIEGQVAPTPIALIREYFPRVRQGVLDVALEQEQCAQVRRLATFFVDELVASGASYFLIDSQGIYRDVRLAPAADPPIPATEMLGLSLREVMGEETSREVLRAISQCLRSQKNQTAFYGDLVQGEERLYSATVGYCSPTLCGLLVRRLR